MVAKPRAFIVLRKKIHARGNWSPERDWIYRGAALLASTKSATGYPYHYSLDHLGTPRLVTKSTTNGSGQAIKVAAHNYYPFGEESTSPTQDTERMKFTGHERDFMAAGTTDDLDYMRARHYGVQIGRFFSVDPVGGVPGQPQNWNRYSYVRGNPINLTDPYGLFPCPGFEGLECQEEITVYGEAPTTLDTLRQGADFYYSLDYITGGPLNGDVVAPETGEVIGNLYDSY